MPKYALRSILHSHDDRPRPMISRFWTKASYSLSGSLSMGSVSEGVGFFFIGIVVDLFCAICWNYHFHYLVGFLNDSGRNWAITNEPVVFLIPHFAMSMGRVRQN